MDSINIVKSLRLYNREDQIWLSYWSPDLKGKNAILNENAEQRKKQPKKITVCNIAAQKIWKSRVLFLVDLAFTHDHI